MAPGTCGHLAVLRHPFQLPQLTPPPSTLWWGPAHLCLLFPRTWCPTPLPRLCYLLHLQPPDTPPLQMQGTQGTPAQPLTHVSQQPTPMGWRQVQSRQLVLSHDSPRENCFPSYSQGAAKETVVMKTHRPVLRVSGSPLDTPMP